MELQNKVMKYITKKLTVANVLFIILFISLAYQTVIQYSKFQDLDFRLASYIGFKDLSNTTAILFGITAGLLSLIGILAVFLTLNTHQRAYKAREIFWDLMGLSGEIKDTHMPRYIKDKLHFYRTLTKKQPDITVIGISFIKQVVVSVITMWTSFLVIWCFMSRSFETWFITSIIIAASYFLLKFLNTIDTFDNILDIIKLPSFDQILDASCHKEEINTLELALRGSFSLINRFSIEERLSLFIDEGYYEDTRRYYRERSFRPDSELSAEIFTIGIHLPEIFLGIKVFFRVEYWETDIMRFCQSNSTDFSGYKKYSMSSCKINFYIPYSVRNYDKIKILIDFKTSEGNAWVDLKYNVADLLTMKPGLVEINNLNIGELVSFDEEQRKIFRRHLQ